MISEVNKKSDVNFLELEGLVMVYFFAEWSEPCIRICPMIDEISRDYSDRVNVQKLDVDTSPDTAGIYKISIIPTVMFFKNGQKLHEIVCVPTKEQITTAIESLC